MTVLASVYGGEKGWIERSEDMLPKSDLEDPAIAWFLAERDGQPLGTARVVYEIPKEVYDTYGFDLIDADIDVEAFLAVNRVAEIGRFAVLSDSRSKILVAAELMRASTVETLGRGFTHYVTDVFEDDPNSPYGFHHRVVGFRTVATHRHGELRTDSRRLTMLLDFSEALKRLRAKNNWFYRYVTQDLDDELIERLCA